IEQSIFIMIHNPLSIICAARTWYDISCSHTTRAKWLIFHHGKSHALFNTVKKGPKFLIYDQLKALFSLNILPSRYFVQRLILVFGQVDGDLVNMKIRNEISDYDISLMRKTKSSWAADIDFNVFYCILTKAHELYGKENLKIRGNDMELFHFLSGGSKNLADAKIILENNYDKISELISIYRFTPFPRRPNFS
ncbi:32554_t:CDS:1, partial [Racocetra persica]